MALNLNSSVTTVISLADLNNIVASSLVCGYGYNVCCVLLVLADCVLANQYKVKPVIYNQHNDLTNNNNDNNSLEVNDEIDEEPEIRQRSDSTIKRRLSSDDDGDVDDDNHDEQEISDYYQHSFTSGTGIGGGVGGKGGAAGTGNHLGHSMLFGAPIDPVAWKEETERVGRVLATQQVMSNNSLLGATEWSSHLQLLKNYTEVTGTASNNNISTNAKVPSKAEETPSRSTTSNKVIINDMVTSIAQLKGYLDGNLAQIKTAETYLNNKHNISTLTYSSVKKVRNCMMCFDCFV